MTTPRAPKATRTRKVKELRPKALTPHAVKSVRGGQQATKHPAKVTTPDIKL